MAEYKYAFSAAEDKKVGKACSKSLPISLKKSVELATAIRGKKVSAAISYLEQVIEKKAVVPYRRFGTEMAHRRGAGIDTGGYPINVAKAFLKLLKSAEKNASEQEVEGALYILSVSARKGPSRYHMGRMAGRKMKATHVEIVVGARK